jgi:hypothetical protein
MIARRIVSLVALAGILAISGCAADETVAEPESTFVPVPCPQRFVDETIGEPDTDGEYPNVTATQLAASEFLPAAVGRLIEGGCMFRFDVVNEDSEHAIYSAYFPGGEELFAEIEQALVAEGYRIEDRGFYIARTGEYFGMYANDETLFSPQQLQGDGIAFLGDEYIVTTFFVGLDFSS